MKRLAAALLLFAVPASGQDPTPASVRTDIATDLPDNQAMEISAADVRGVLNDIVDIIPVGADIDLRVAAWARTSAPSGTIDTDRLAAGGVTDDVLSRTATGHAWRTVTIPTQTTIDGRIATWARASNPSLTAPFSRLPFPDCAQGEILERGQTAWGCDTDADTLPASWALASMPSSRAPLARLPEQLSRIPAADCTNGQIWKREASAWACAADAVGAGGGINTATALGLIAGFARAGTNASGTIPLARLATGGATGNVLTRTASAFVWQAPGRVTTDADIDARISDFAKHQSSVTIPISRLATGGSTNDVLTRTGATAFGWRTPPSIPGNSDIDGRIQTWARTNQAGLSTAQRTVPGGVIDNALTRDGEIPAALLVGQTTGPDTATTNQVLFRYQDGAGQDRLDFDWGSVSLVTDWSSLTYTMARANVATQARQVTIAAGAINTNHDLSVVSGCIRIGTNGGGPYYYSASSEVTPNRSDDTDPTDEGGPHRNFAIWEIRRTRGASTQPVFRTSPYVRGWQTNSSPASQWVSFDGRIPTQAGDTYCIYVDATRASAHQADYMTITGGEIALSRDRLVITR